MLREVSIEILRKCPNCCVHCSSLSAQFCQEILPYGVFAAAIIDAAKLGAKVISISGGEPFLHPDLPDMVQFIHSLGLEAYIYTSGIGFASDGQRGPIEPQTLQAVSENVTKIIFNIEAGNSETYDVIMGTTGCFDLMKQSIAAAVNLGIHTEAHFVPMRLNIGQIEQVLQLCRQLGVEKVSFLRLVLHGRAQQNATRLALSDTELQKLKYDLAHLNKQLSSEIRIGVPLSTNTSCRKCEAAVGKLNIRYDGKVFPCEVFKNGSADIALGGLLPESIYDRSLLDIYQNSPYLQRVRKLAKEALGSGYDETCVGQSLINQESRCVEHGD